MFARYILSGWCEGGMSSFKIRDMTNGIEARLEAANKISDGLFDITYGLAWMVIVFVLGLFVPDLQPSRCGIIFFIIWKSFLGIFLAGFLIGLVEYIYNKGVKAELQRQLPVDAL